MVTLVSTFYRFYSQQTAAHDKQSVILIARLSLFNVSVVLFYSLFSVPVPDTSWKEVFILSGFSWCKVKLISLPDQPPWLCTSFTLQVTSNQISNLSFLCGFFFLCVVSFFDKLWNEACVRVRQHTEREGGWIVLCLWTRVELNLEERERERCHLSVKCLANKSWQSRGGGRERKEGEKIWRSKG